MFKKLETPEMAKKKKKLCLVCQVTPSSYKSLSVEGICQLPKLNKYCLGAELAPVYQVIKKLKMDHL